MSDNFLKRSEFAPAKYSILLPSKESFNRIKNRESINRKENKKAILNFAEVSSEREEIDQTDQSLKSKSTTGSTSSFIEKQKKLGSSHKTSTKSKTSTKQTKSLIVPSELHDSNYLNNIKPISNHVLEYTVILKESFVNFINRNHCKIPGILLSDLYGNNNVKIAHIDLKELIETSICLGYLNGIDEFLDIQKAHINYESKHLDQIYLSYNSSQFSNSDVITRHLSNKYVADIVKYKSDSYKHEVQLRKFNLKMLRDSTFIDDKDMFDSESNRTGETHKSSYFISKRELYIKSKHIKNIELTSTIANDLQIVNTAQAKQPSFDMNNGKIWQGYITNGNILYSNIKNFIWDFTEPLVDTKRAIANYTGVKLRKYSFKSAVKIFRLFQSENSTTEISKYISETSIETLNQITLKLPTDVPVQNSQLTNCNIKYNNFPSTCHRTTLKYFCNGYNINNNQNCTSVLDGNSCLNIIHGLSKIKILCKLFFLKNIFQFNGIFKEKYILPQYSQNNFIDSDEMKESASKSAEETSSENSDYEDDDIYDETNEPENYSPQKIIGEKIYDKKQGKSNITETKGANKLKMNPKKKSSESFEISSDDDETISIRDDDFKKEMKKKISPNGLIDTSDYMPNSKDDTNKSIEDIRSPQSYEVDKHQEDDKNILDDSIKHLSISKDDSQENINKSIKVTKNLPEKKLNKSTEDILNIPDEMNNIKTLTHNKFSITSELKLIKEVSEDDNNDEGNFVDEEYNEDDYLNNMKFIQQTELHIDSISSFEDTDKMKVAEPNRRNIRKKSTVKDLFAQSLESLDFLEIVSSKENPSSILEMSTLPSLYINSKTETFIEEDSIQMVSNDFSNFKSTDDIDTLASKDHEIITHEAVIDFELSDNGENNVSGSESSNESSSSTELQSVSDNDDFAFLAADPPKPATSPKTNLGVEIEVAELRGVICEIKPENVCYTLPKKNIPLLSQQKIAENDAPKSTFNDNQVEVPTNINLKESHHKLQQEVEVNYEILPNNDSHVIEVVRYTAEGSYQAPLPVDISDDDKQTNDSVDYNSDIPYKYSEYKTLDECTESLVHNLPGKKMTNKSSNSHYNWWDRFNIQYLNYTNLNLTKRLNYEKISKNEVVLAAFCALYNPIYKENDLFDKFGFSDYFSKIKPSIKASLVYKNDTQNFNAYSNNLIRKSPLIRSFELSNVKPPSSLSTTSLKLTNTTEDNIKVFEFIKNIVINLKLRAHSNHSIETKIKYARRILSDFIEFYYESLQQKHNIFSDNYKDLIAYVNLVEKNFHNYKDNKIYSNSQFDKIHLKYTQQNFLTEIPDLNLQLNMLMTGKITVEYLLNYILNLLTMKNTNILLLKNRIMSSYDHIQAIATNNSRGTIRKKALSTYRRISRRNKPYEFKESHLNLTFKEVIDKKHNNKVTNKSQTDTIQNSKCCVIHHLFSNQNNNHIPSNKHRTRKSILRYKRDTLVGIPSISSMDSSDDVTGFKKPFRCLFFAWCYRIHKICICCRKKPPPAKIRSFEESDLSM